MKRLVAVLRRKDSSLRYRLENFLVADVSAEEFASSRLRAYAETLELEPPALKVVCFSRFFTTRGLIVSERYDTALDQDVEALNHLRAVFRTKGSTEFNKIVQQKLETDKDVFDEAVKEYVGDAKALGAFRDFERAVWKKIPTDVNAFLLHDFNSLNRATLSYAKKNLTREDR